MARQTMNDKNVRRIARKTGLDVRRVWVRGGTDHRKMLGLSDGTIRTMDKHGVVSDSALPVMWSGQI